MLAWMLYPFFSVLPCFDPVIDGLYANDTDRNSRLEQTGLHT